MNRTALSESFNKAAQTLEESTDSARKMLESLQQDGKLLIAPRKETMNYCTMQREVNLECSNNERTIMKVQKTQEKVFTPVQLNITFETKEEYDAFYDMLQYDASICNIVYGKNYDSRCTLQDVMIGISESL